jgi:dTDP-4-dehydrorhamnose 3,5-epimerase
VDIAALEISDAFVCTPRQFGDDRGTFLEWFRGDELAKATGRGFAPVQANHSVSRRGTLRGIHFADVPPGQAKYVYCPRGAVLDVIVDLRVGSPSYGKHAAVRLDDVDRRGVFIAEGLGHGFYALTDDANVAYLVSTAYNPAIEHAVHPLDPDLALPWPVGEAGLDDDGPVLSEKDAAAPSLAEAQARGLLPSYDACRDFYATL